MKSSRVFLSGFNYLHIDYDAINYRAMVKQGWVSQLDGLKVVTHL